jgi:ribosomal protein S18 acetylase RimI-like enzyme
VVSHHRIKRARLTVTVANADACKLYERCGYDVARSGNGKRPLAVAGQVDSAATQRRVRVLVSDAHLETRLRPDSGPAALC